MNALPQDAWFFTREGEQVGPVTFSELRVKAQEGTLNPRLDMVWTQGMADWQAAGEIEDLFEKRSTAPSLPPPDLAKAAANPYTPPQPSEAAAMLGQEGGWPGARRRSFYLMTILFPVFWNIGFAAGLPFLSQQFGPEIMGVATIGAALVPLVVALYFGLQRLANVGMSRWWYLGNLVPILNLWVSYRMYVCPAGYAYHKKLDGAGVVLAILYWLMILLAVLMLASILAVMFGALGSPELRQQVEEALRNLQQEFAKP
ncbi:MAG: DUF4339 domain-containing protein [Verrucomicrobiaceae bacterium]|jgi:hypothetical protein|nr:MAG: DUF4339 domain-containing protein [Verrucomicrobiaceae bacterium]